MLLVWLKHSFIQYHHQKHSMFANNTQSTENSPTKKQLLFSFDILHLWSRANKFRSSNFFHQKKWKNKNTRFFFHSIVLNFKKFESIGKKYRLYRISNHKRIEYSNSNVFVFVWDLSWFILYEHKMVFGDNYFLFCSLKNNHNEWPAWEREKERIYANWRKKINKMDTIINSIKWKATTTTKKKPLKSVLSVESSSWWW